MFEALYIHVPFCASKCAYCAFYSLPGASERWRRAYLAQLAEELVEKETGGSALNSVFIGGGTPSVLSAAELSQLLGLVRERFHIADPAEWTVECNPDSLSCEKIDVMARHGVTRVSLGVQSFSPRLRNALGRGGSIADLSGIVATLRGAGITNLNVDMIYGIPGQTLADWSEDLERALSLGVCHLSTYALTLEEGTRLAELGQDIPDDALTVSMWRRAAEVAESAGLRRYEVSNLAVPGRECSHNMRIWHGGTYLGCGPAASSFDGRLRWTNPADLDAWLNGTPAVDDALPPADRAAEILAFGLRTCAGWERNAFRARTGFDYLALRSREIAELAEDGLLELSSDYLRPTEEGLLFADTVAERLL